MGQVSEKILEFAGMVQQVAGEYRKKFSMVEKEDIEQELWLWFASHPVKFQDWIENHDEKDSTRLIARSLRNAAHDYCIKEKAIAEGYNSDDNFWYTKEFVKILLPGVLTDNWEKMENALSNMGRSTKAPSESGDWLAHGADIRSAYDKLDEQEQNLVHLFYAQDMDGDELHEQADDKRSTAKATAMAANRALNKMVRHLGGFAPFSDKDYSNAEQ